jgi:hypothetical protein
LGFTAAAGSGCLGFAATAAAGGLSAAGCLGSAAAASSGCLSAADCLGFAAAAADGHAATGCLSATGCLGAAADGGLGVAGADGQAENTQKGQYDFFHGILQSADVHSAKTESLQRRRLTAAEHVP